MICEGGLRIGERGIGGQRGCVEQLIDFLLLRGFRMLNSS